MSQSLTLSVQIFSPLFGVVGVVVRALDLRLKRSQARLFVLSCNNLGQVVHTLMLLSPSSIIWYPSRGGDALWLGR